MLATRLNSISPSSLFLIKCELVAGNVAVYVCVNLKRARLITKKGRALLVRQKSDPVKGARLIL